MCALYCNNSFTEIFMKGSLPIVFRELICALDTTADSVLVLCKSCSLNFR